MWLGVQLPRPRAQPEQFGAIHSDPAGGDPERCGLLGQGFVQLCRCLPAHSWALWGQGLSCPLSDFPLLSQQCLELHETTNTSSEQAGSARTASAWCCSEKHLGGFVLPRAAD